MVLFYNFFLFKCSFFFLCFVFKYSSTSFWTRATRLERAGEESSPKTQFFVCFICMVYPTPSPSHVWNVENLFFLFSRKSFEFVCSFSARTYQNDEEFSVSKKKKINKKTKDSRRRMGDTFALHHHRDVVVVRGGLYLSSVYIYRLYLISEWLNPPTEVWSQSFLFFSFWLNIVFLCGGQHIMEIAIYFEWRKSEMMEEINYFTLLWNDILHRKGTY